MARPIHPLVKTLAAGVDAPAVRGTNIQQATAAAYNAAPDTPRVIMFAGFFGDEVSYEGKQWQVLYTDLELAECLLIEEGGILAEGDYKDDTVPFNQKRNVLWVRADAVVGRAQGSHDTPGRFLTGEFTSAANFEVPLTGGTLAAATGVFCEARTPSCCGQRSRPRPH